MKNSFIPGFLDELGVSSLAQMTSSSNCPLVMTNASLRSPCDFKHFDTAAELLSTQWKHLTSVTLSARHEGFPTLVVTSYLSSHCFVIVLEIFYYCPVSMIFLHSVIITKLIVQSWSHTGFLPRCMECRRGLAMRILSVCPSVCQTRALWHNERKICPYFYTIRKII